MSVTALVRPPSPLLSQGLVTHIERSDNVDFPLALRQWNDYVSVLESNGGNVYRAPPLDESPDGVFIEDNMLHVADESNSTVIIMNSSSPERREEVLGLEEEFLYVTLEGRENVTR